MSLIRALVRLVLHVLVGVLLALGVAVVLALVHGGGFRHAFVIACWSVAALAILLGAVGQGTSASTIETAGRLPGMPAVLRNQAGDRSLSTGATFVLTGAVLILVAIVLG